MTERLFPLDDAALEASLRDLGGAIAFPSPGADRPDVAARVRSRIEASSAAGAVPGWRGRFASARRRLRRSVVLALAAVLLLAAVAAAVGLGLPGIRILLGPLPSLSPSPSAPVGSASPSASATALGGGLGLGLEIPMEIAPTRVDFPVRLPGDPTVGAPATAWFDSGRLAFVWPTSTALPATLDPRVGLLLTEFRGSVERGFIEKIAGGGTSIEPVTVGGSPGYWLSGAPHFFFYRNAEGVDVVDTHRFVGDTLIWAVGDVTYRLETSLGRAEAIRIAESLR